MTQLASKAAKALVLSFMTVLLMTASTLAAEEDMAIAAGTTTGSSLRLRESASTSSAILTHLDKDTTVAILDDSVSGWYKIAYNGQTGYVSADFLSKDSDHVFESYARVNGDRVNVRAGASTNDKVLASIDTGTIVTVNGLVDGWYDVTCKYGTEGYIRSDFLDLANSADATAPSASGNSIVDTAMKHMGVRYVWGGSSPKGFDCSGFTMYIYQQFGYSISHSAATQWLSGPGTQVWSISALQPGDLVFFNDPSRSNGKACSHAGIYIGNSQFVHASSAKSGVIISDLSSGYYNRYFVGGRHV